MLVHFSTLTRHTHTHTHRMCYRNDGSCARERARLFFHLTDVAESAINRQQRGIPTTRNNKHQRQRLSLMLLVRRFVMSSDKHARVYYKDYKWADLWPKNFRWSRTVPLAGEAERGGEHAVRGMRALANRAGSS